MVEHSRDCPASLGPMDCCCGAERTTVIRNYPVIPDPGVERDQMFSRVFATPEGAILLAYLRHGSVTADEIYAGVERARKRWMTGVSA
jgi:hypothetical protein